MADKLGVYNTALLHLGERKLAALTENREPRRVLDDLWDGQVKYCLERGQWKFALRSYEIASDAAIDPVFGYAYAFEVPGDYVSIDGLSASDYFDPPLNRVHEEAGYWFADVDPIYVQVVSDDPAYGLDLSRWPESFSNYVAIRLARMACKRITQSDSGVDELIKAEKKARIEALSADAKRGPAKRPPQGSWVTARGGASARRYDRA